MTQTDPGQTPLPGSTPPGQPPAAGGMTVQNWTVICHLSALAGIFTAGAGCVVGPLVVWLLKGKEDPRIDAHGKAALNFQISMMIYMAAAFVLMLPMGIIFFARCGMGGVFLLPLIGVFDLVWVVVACVKASNGELFQYPLSLKLIK